ncbi:hypothetical protein [Kribbella sp. NPDC051137]|uniref:hypothetical protein n=1 Tax=Kribbella sp. NPDC051137 TaxID=3155045 RepID=UPI002F5CE4F5
MPPPCDPTSLHQAFEASRPLNWGDSLPSTAEIARLYGDRATRESLQLLEHATTVEPTVTSQFLAALPPGTTPYQLDRRVKSPDSLARKIVDWRAADSRRPIDDLLRYTVLTESPDELVAAARRTADALNDHDWRVRTAMHSYTDGSRYKGLHAGMTIPGCPRIEVQFHSVASAQVKEATTRWYEIERSSTATPDERAEARRRCAEASEVLKPPRGIDGLTQLAGARVAVNNYSDSRQDPAATRRRAAPRGQHMPRSTTLDKKTDGIAR